MLPDDYLTEEVVPAVVVNVVAPQNTISKYNSATSDSSYPAAAAGQVQINDVESNIQSIVHSARSRESSAPASVNDDEANHTKQRDSTTRFSTDSMEVMGV